MSAPGSYQEWWTTIPLSWLTTGPIGALEAAANGVVFDQQVQLIKLATTAHMPSYAPSDALPHIGADRQIEQGPGESNANFVTRLKTAWDDWARAGTALELLVQLYWGGFGGAVIAQQNGLLYSLSGAPTAGVDPTSLLQINLAMPNPAISQIPRQAIALTCNGGGALGTATFALTVNGVSQGTITPASSAILTWLPLAGTDTWLAFPSTTYTIGDAWSVTAAGVVTSSGALVGATYNAAPWWNVDPDISHTSRFAVLLVGGSIGFVMSGTATFTGAENGSTVPWPTVTWSTPFLDTNYKVQVGAIYASQPVVVNAVASTKTLTGCGLIASGPFVGTVDVLAWEDGADPFGSLGVDDIARLRRLIARWKPAKAICSGIYEIIKAPVWDYPTTTTWDQAGLTWDSGSSVFVGA